MKTKILWLLLFSVLLGWPFSTGRAQTNKHSVTLNWNASSTPGVSYNIYRGTAAGGPYSKLDSAPISGGILTYTDTTGTGGIKYFYVATAIDASGSESAFSNEVSATFLGAPSAPTGLAAVSN